MIIMKLNMEFHMVSGQEEKADGKSSGKIN